MSLLEPVKLRFLLVWSFALCLGSSAALAAPEAAGQASATGRGSALQSAGQAARGWVGGAVQALGVGPQVIDQVRETTSDLVISAMNFLGVPYRRGGESAETGFDCSGFTRHVFENSVGRLLPRRSRDQAMLGDLLTIAKDDLKPGDLVFFNTMRSAFSHVGIYVGEGKFIHAPRTGSHIRVDDMREAYWTQRFNGARRAPELAGNTTWRMPSLPGGALPTETTSVNR